MEVSMKKLIFYVVLSTVMSFMILGNSVLIKNVVYTKSVKGEWSKKTFENNGFTLPYQIYTPKDTKNKKLPLVIYLHGTGEAGTDNEAQMYKGKNIGPDYFSSRPGDLAGIAYDSTPIRCSSGRRWIADASWSGLAISV